MESAVFSFGTLIATAAPFSLLLPGSWGDTGNDAWLATGHISHISVAIKPQLTAVLPVYVRVYDALVEASQIVLRGGTGTQFAGKANLGATAYTPGRTWTHPSLGAVSTDVFVINSASSIPADLLGLREVYRCNGGEFAALTASVPQVGNPVVLQVNKECPHGMLVVLQNVSGVDITIAAGGISASVVVHYLPRVTGRQRQRTRTLPNRAAAMN